MPSAEITIQTTAPYPIAAHWRASKATIRQFKILSAYAALYCIAIATLSLTPHSAGHALALGLLFPGGGFWQFSTILGSTTALLFILSLIGWFATGNIIAPGLIWAASFCAAPILVPQNFAVDQGWNVSTLVLVTAPPILLLVYAASRATQRRIGHRERDHFNTAIQMPAPAFEQVSPQTEVSVTDLQRQRLLLDRALQSVEKFDGFEWIDQFQTSAVRYQLNFLSYALSITQAAYTPAFKGYLHTAQDNLLAKQQDPRIWTYWKLENMWGNLRTCADPIARDNIMYSGFVAAQITYRNNAISYPYTDSTKGLNCHAKNGQKFDYTLDALIDVLHAQYVDGNGDLLPCEPNWVYPLCNAITASAIRAHDTAAAQQSWLAVRDGFQRSLETDYLTPGGRFIPFRSCYTGIAPPLIGGAVMQAFPCYFLNATLPEIAQRQWMRLHDEMKHKDWRRALWPIDVGNYNFSRASSFTATAAAAREMGDHDTANHLLDLLDEDCPAQNHGGVLHRPKASLWAHANEMLARSGTHNSLQRIAVTQRRLSDKALSPYLHDISYPDILVAKAITSNGRLDLVLYPGTGSGIKSLSICGLRPSTEYKISMAVDAVFVSDPKGNARLNLPINGRTPLRIHPSQPET